MLATYNVRLVEGATPDVKNLYRDDGRILKALQRGSTDPDFFERSEAEVDIDYKANGFGPLIRIFHKAKRVCPV